MSARGISCNSLTVRCGAVYKNSKTSPGDIENRIGCTVHLTKNELKKDPKFKQMKKDTKEIISKRKETQNDEERNQIARSFALKRAEMKKYAQDKYQEVLKSTLDQIKKEHPELLDENGNLQGYTSTNGMEGGNWRIKYGVRVSHIRNDSSAGRNILAAIKDSIFAMRGGKARESLANIIGFFRFTNIMSGVSGIQR